MEKGATHGGSRPSSLRPEPGARLQGLLAAPAGAQSRRGVASACNAVAPQCNAVASSGNAISPPGNSLALPDAAAVHASAAFPNPFKESTTISYTLAQKAPVYLAVYNSQGQPVGVLVDEAQEPGQHTVEFKTAPLKSGLYIYRLKAGDQTQSGKLLKE